MQVRKHTRSHLIHHHNVLLLPQVLSQFLCLHYKNHTEKYSHTILDTQSDSTFVLVDVLDKLNVDVQPVKLKPSTMTAINTIISSNSVHGLQVRELHSESCIQL